MKTYKVGLIILFIIYLCRLFLSTLNYCRSQYSLEFFEENDPEIYFYGLESFNFTKNNLDFEGTNLLLKSSNLGTTGKVSYDCYEGICYHEYNYLDSYSTEKTTIFDCSRNCRVNKNGVCTPYNCSLYYNYKYIESECIKAEFKSDELNNEQSCFLDNLILYWKGLYYERKNYTYTKYSYLVISDNETCPDNHKSCGILDDLGHRLCVRYKTSCPINFITTNESEILNITDNYKAVNLTDDITIYYTNNSNVTGRIVQGLYVDSDLALMYTDGCEVIDTENITDLLNDHKNKLYKDVLSYDPYKDYNINLKGKSYLKWCSPGFGQNINLTIMKEIDSEFYRNVTENDVICGVRRIYEGLYFFELGAHIILLIFYIISLCLKIEEKEPGTCDSGICKCCDCNSFICLCILFIFNIPGLVIFSVSISRFNDLEYSSNSYCYNTIIGYKIIDIINLVLCIIYFISIIVVCVDE